MKKMNKDTHTKFDALADELRELEARSGSEYAGRLTAIVRAAIDAAESLVSEIEDDHDIEVDIDVADIFDDVEREAESLVEEILADVMEPVDRIEAEDEGEEDDSAASSADDDTAKDAKDYRSQTCGTCECFLSCDEACALLPGAGTDDDEDSGTFADSPACFDWRDAEAEDAIIAGHLIGHLGEDESIADAVWEQRRMRDGVAPLKYSLPTDDDACPGCGCKPGDGTTEGCDHPDGCGFFAAVERAAKA